ncbi:uncharacterized protein LACBIDRAFT_308224 [Laccaria bicolor S238N-H82]|uniref:Predicted protein n=1 Tax=Laccaria bicolor (strain S238N-H82 / ATCC MYA-4686) TaxID=486041 RepID=B0DRV8_LACBS|nr:uncharacterized protein LACBIDRAFT_308224 [Laccaria bicolor S238N-H82]EDR02680.1 predicted protein [Laccaria bicolor S238N-H82]|eukprot:XP_001886724.1 predicted protein [Laccaria bicolor S238N-H82]
MTQEDALAYMDGDEIVEVTPGSVTLRKIVLDQAKRARMKGGRSRIPYASLARQQILYQRNPRLSCEHAGSSPFLSPQAAKVMRGLSCLLYDN